MIPDILKVWGASPTSEAGFIWVLCIFLSSYLLGSIPTGILISKLFKLGNIRNIGSGNIGATNVLRTGNKKAALITLLIDLIKGLIAVFIAKKFLGITASHFAAIGVFFGHIFSIFLLFKGGKGVATFLGIQMIFNFYLGIFICFIWLVVAVLTRFSSLSALIASFSSILILILIKDFSYMWVQIILVITLWINHRMNILRLVSGDETKIKII